VGGKFKKKGGLVRGGAEVGLFEGFVWLYRESVKPGPVFIQNFIFFS
jgi:hypothetical protein